MTKATVWKHNTPFKSFTRSVRHRKRCHRVILSINKENPVSSLDALKAACEALFGINLLARRWPECCVIETEGADVLLVIYPRKVLSSIFDPPHSVAGTNSKD
jgi:hypothetical protein